MRNSIFTGIAILVLALVIAVAVWFQVTAMDALRFQTENLMKQVNELRDKMEVMGRERPAAQVPTAIAATPTAAALPPFANREFFDPAAIPGGTMRDASAQDTQNMNLLINNDNILGELSGLVCSSLAERNFVHPEKFEPVMAASWTISPDKMTYRIKLRKGILWHDFTDPVTGKEWKDVEVTADDFKFYIDVIKNPEVDCAPARVYLDGIDKVTVINPYEFEVKWNKRYFLSEEITLGLTPLPRHLYHAYPGPFDGKKFNDDDARNRILIGCGPYRFDSWTKGQRMILKRWEKYFGQRYGAMPPIKEYSFEIIKHPNTQFQALVSGSIDTLGLNPEQWVTRTDTKEFGPDGFIGKYRYPGRRYFYIGYNLTNPLFKDKKVRQALTCLVNRERILKEVYYGLGRIVTGPFFIDSPYYDKTVQPWPFSVEKAKRMLAEAGWKDTDGDGILDKNGKPFKFTVLQVANSPIQQKMLPIIKEDMARAGIEMNIQTVEWSVYVQRLEKKSFEVCCLGWALSFEGDPFQLWHSSQADKPQSSNHVGFKNAEADRLIEAYRTSFDLQERIELAHRFHQLLHEEQPYTFLISPDLLLAENKRFHNVRVFPAVGVPTTIQWTKPTATDGE